MQAALRQSSEGGSGAFLARTFDGDRYWVKTLNSPQGDRVAITEQLVGKAGSLIGAPVRPVAVVYIPKDLEGWEFRKGRRLQPGCAHGSLALANCVERKGQLPDREKDENARRHAGYFALYDWCWGGDVQALLDLTDDRALHSHDHGWFLPPIGAQWDIMCLQSEVSTPHELKQDGAGIDMIEVQRLATRLEQITQEEVLGVVTSIPRAWPVTDAELGAVAQFLHERAPEVAARMRARFGGGV